MRWTLPLRGSVAGILALLLAASAAALVTTTPAKKKHRAPAASQSKTKAHAAGTARGTAHGPARPTAAKTGASASHTRARVNYSVPVSPMRKAALIEQIDERLKEPVKHPIAYDAALDGFYAQLASHQSAERSAGVQTGTVRVLQFGDSHTAADMFTGEARRVFQQQFGDGGVGFSYAGHPFAGYRILGSERSQSRGWKTQGNRFLQLGDGQTGMGGIRISTERAGESVTLDAACSTLELEYLEQPGGGGIRFTDNNGDPLDIETNAGEVGPGSFSYSCPPGEHHFEVTTEQNAPVTLLGWVTTQPGVTWESIGINGAEAPLILKWDQNLFSRYLKETSPALIVLAYGTNEAASSYWDEETYQQTFASIIDTLHEYVPESSILVIGPADRSLGRRRTWHPYTGTEKIVQAQRAVCRTHDCAYWDQQQRMGGLGSMQDWAYAGWAQPDHTHFTGEGYRALADTLMADLMAGYKTYKDHNSSDTETEANGAADANSSTNR